MQTRRRMKRMAQREMPAAEAAKGVREILGEVLVEWRVKGSVEELVLKRRETRAVEEELREREFS